MVEKAKKTVIAFILMGVIILTGCTNTESASGGKNEGNKPTEVFEIGISQLIEHPALDNAREGFIDGLASEGFKDGENIKIDFQNAQGDIPTTQLIAQNFVTDQKDIIFTVATPSAQAAFNATKDIPILITAVTDPVEAGLAESWEKTNTNVTGTSDISPIKEQFELLQQLIPEAKKIGILYNTSEINSEIQINRAQKIAKEKDLEIITSGVTNVNEIPQALNALLEQVDCIYTPTDNLLASSMPLIIRETNKKGIPVIGAESDHVKSGALATEGIDYYELGFQTAFIAIEVLQGKSPSDMPISTLETTQLIINEDTAEILKVDIPEDLRQKAQILQGGEIQ